MQRISPIEPPYPDDIVETFSRLMPKGIEPLQLFRTVANNPRVLRRMQRGGLLDPGSISLRHREIAILRTCALCGAHYESTVHALFFGATAKLTQEQLRALAELQAPSLPLFSVEERLVIEVCDALHHESNVGDDLLVRLKAVFDSAQIIELTMLAGLYHAVGFIVNVCGIEPEPWFPTERP